MRKGRQEMQRKKKRAWLATSRVLIQSRGLWALRFREVTFRSQMVSCAILKLLGFRCAVGSAIVKIVQVGDQVVEGLTYKN